MSQNAPPLPQHLLRPPDAASPQCELPLATAGVLRYVWEGRYGSMLIEVMGGEVFVNGQRVEPHCP
jgi:hypothetical protein